MRPLVKMFSGVVDDDEAGPRPSAAGGGRSQRPGGDDDLRAVRNRALLHVGFGGGLRRSEFVRLDVEDIELVDEGLVVTLRRSKTDQEGAGRRIGIPHGEHHETCPGRGLQAWLDSAAITEGPLFHEITPTGEFTEHRMSAQAVTRTVKRGAKLAGLDRDLRRRAVLTPSDVRMSGDVC